MTSFYNEAVVDSVVWIGVKSKRDQYKKISRALMDSFIKGEIRKILITDYVLLETISFLLKKSGFEEAIETLNMFLQNERIEIVFVDELMLETAKSLFEKYRDLSLTDCSIIALMEEKKIKTLFSFDNGFDKIKGIIRKESI